MADRPHLSIGEVLSLLRDEFPDITISKIRFLESQGLLDPERTPSGYRKFYDDDVERLRWILRQQREHFLPLKVIKGRLTEAGSEPDEAARRKPTSSAPGPAPAAASAGGAAGAERAGTARGGADRAASGPDGGATTGAAGGSGRGGVATASPVGATGSAATTGADGGGPAGPGGSRSGAGGSGAGGSGAGGSGASSSGGSGSVAAASRGSAGAGSVQTGSGSAGAGSAQAGSRGSSSGAGSPGGPASGGPSTGGPASGGPASGGPASGGSASGGSASPGGESGGAATPGPAGARAEQPATTGGDAANARSDRRDPRPPGPTAAALVDPSADVNLTVAELALGCGLSVAMVRELERFGLVSGRDVGGTIYYGAEAQQVVKLASVFAAHGVEARHLRMYKNAADRESGVFEQVVMPLIKQRNPNARLQAADTLDELASLGRDLREILLRRALRDAF